MSDIPDEDGSVRTPVIFDHQFREGDGDELHNKLQNYQEVRNSDDQSTSARNNAFVPNTQGANEQGFLDPATGNVVGEPPPGIQPTTNFDGVMIREQHCHPILHQQSNSSL